MSKLYHIGIDKNLEVKYAVLPGDPDRAEKIAAHFDNPYFVGKNREFTTYCGTICGEKVLTTSTGIGGPSAAIAVEELYMAGVRTFIRVGTCGGMQTQITGGDIVIPTAAVRMEGTSREYTPIEYPAVADFGVTTALSNAAKSLGYQHHIGVVQSKDSFYGQHSPDRMPVQHYLESSWNAWIKSGCLASEMECAALFTVSGVLRARSGAVLTALWNQERAKQSLSNIQVQNNDRAIRTAIEAIKILINTA